MKILHTADWHLGHKLHEQSQYEEQQMFLDWLIKHIKEEQYDVLLISGDVFDTAMPSNQSLEQYYSFLISLQGSCCQHIVITGGNHDSPGTLNAPKSLLNILNIYVVGKATETLEDELFLLKVNEESVWVAAVPYLRDQDVRKAVSGESFEGSNERYKAALIHHYDKLATLCKEQNKNEYPVLAMGHLFAIGGSISDSEKEISVGSLGHIGAEDFNTYFDYVALGHLHKPQKVGGNNHIRYSGSPVILSFSELGYEKKMIGIETENKVIKEITEVNVPVFRPVLKIKGTLEDCLFKIEAIDSNDHQLLKPWIEVVIDNDDVLLDIQKIKEKAERLSIHVSKITLKNKKELKGLDEILEEVKEIKVLKPSEIFEKKCEEMNFDLNQNSEILEAFHQVLQSIQHQNN